MSAEPSPASIAPVIPGAGTSRRGFLQLAGGLAGLMALGACTPAPPPSPSVPLGTEVPSVRFHAQDGVYGRVASDSARDFRLQFPDTALEVELSPPAEYVPKLEASLADATAADCFWAPFATGVFHQQANAGHLSRLNEWLAQDPVPVLQPALDAATHQGQLFGLPWACHPGRMGCFVNLTLFAQAGVEPPPTDGTWTLDDLRAMARAMTRREGEETTIFGANIGTTFPHIRILIRSLAGTVFNDYGNRALLGSGPVLEALNLLHTLIHADRSMPSPDRQDAFLFEKGNVALSQNGYWGAWIAQSVMGDAFEVGVVPMPHGPEGDAGSMLEIEPLCLHSATPAPAAAWSWLVHLSTQTMGLRLAEKGGVPGARADVWDEASLRERLGHAVFAQAMENVDAYRGPANLRAGEASDMIDQGLAACWYGGELPAAVVPDLEARLNALLAQSPV